MDLKKKAKLIVEFHDKGLDEVFEDLFDRCGCLLESVSDKKFEDISDNSNCAVEEIKKLYSHFIDFKCS